MEVFLTYLILFSTIIILNQIFRKVAVPISLILVVFGMLLGFVPFFPQIHLDPKLVLNIFLPLLIYQISSFSSWKEIKQQIRPIALLSIGHVIFITLLVALTIHWLIPEMGWPLAFVLGAIISPPDDVAITAIAEKIRIPERILIILKGEGIFNDAAALTLFRFALAAALTSQFLFTEAVMNFILVLIGEALYGLLLGLVIGELRTKITDTSLHLIASFITPFLAYIPVVKLGGTGILATSVLGFVIGNQYTLRFTPEYRLAALTIWPTIALGIQDLIFLLVGLDIRSYWLRISAIPMDTLMLYVSSVVLVALVGRFIWVYGFSIFLPRIISPTLRKKDPFPRWQYPFVIAWSGMRGGISLAAALAVPLFTININQANPRDLLVFLVFCIIFVTLVVQGLSLPYLLKKIGIDKVGEHERHTEHMTELQVRLKMMKAALTWLQTYKKQIEHDKELLAEVSMYIYEYKVLKSKIQSRIMHEHETLPEKEDEKLERLSTLCQLITVEKTELENIWRNGKISLKIRNKLMAVLDHQVQRHRL
jgi:Na+/H+ antiporter